MATPMNLTLNQNYEISKSGEYSFSNTGTYEIKIFGSSGNGCKDSNFFILGIEADVGGGGGGGAFGYFRINMTGNDADNNKVKITYSNNDFTVEIKSRNPKNNNIWQANYNVIAGEDGKDLLNGLTTAAGGVISYVSGSNLENAEFLEYAFGSAETNGQNATGMDLDLSIMGLGKGNYSVSGGLGGSYTASDGKSYTGFSGGNGIINTVVSSINQSATDGQKGKIVITYISDSISEGGNSGTTPDPDPEIPGGSGTTPSTGKIDVLTTASITDLKQRVNTEISRRCYYGNISSASKNLSLSNSSIATVKDINEQIIDPLNLIANKITKEAQNNPIKLTYINAELERVGINNFPKINETTKGAAHGCSGSMCTGFCSSTCSDMCVGCGGTAMGGTSNSGGGAGSSNTGSQGSTAPGCTGGCSTNCYGDCVGTGTHPQNASNCGEYCGASCWGNCASSCQSSCTDGCDGNCKTGCEGCSGNCSGGCSGDCDGYCSGGCNTKCTGCSSGCRNKCTHNCAQSCTGSSYST